MSFSPEIISAMPPITKAMIWTHMIMLARTLIFLPTCLFIHSFSFPQNAVVWDDNSLLYSTTAICPAQALFEKNKAAQKTYK